MSEEKPMPGFEQAVTKSEIGGFVYRGYAPLLQLESGANTVPRPSPLIDQSRRVQ